MGMLHEILAVEGDKKERKQKMLEEGRKTFREKHDLFEGFIKSYESFDDNDNEKFEESKTRDTTVMAKADYIFNAIIEYIDCVIQKDSANQGAKADVMIDGVVLIADIPAVTLLTIESEIKQWRDVLGFIPTLEHGIEWDEDKTQGDGVWKTKNPLQTFKTAKEPKSKVLYEATKEHKAEIEKWNETINVGKYLLTKFSGKITSAAKSDILNRVDILSDAVKQARTRANKVEVPSMKIGTQIREYILKGNLPS